MKDFFRFIIFLIVVYFFINWAADNPNGINKLRDDINSAVSGIADYAESLSDGEDKG